MNSGFSLVASVFGGVSVLLLLAGLGVSIVHIGRTRWALPLAGGFGLQALVSLLYRLMPFVLRSLTPETYQVTFLVTSVLSSIAMAAIVAGVAGLLWELKSRPVSAP